jgi:hypothetical protein
MARLLTLLAVVTSLVGFIGQESGWAGWWTIAFSRGSYALVVLAVAASLVDARRPNEFVVAAQVLAAMAAIAFVIVALVKYYDTTSFIPGEALNGALTWMTQAELFGVAALAFALTLARRSSTIGIAALAAAAILALATGIYATILQANFAAFVWWGVAGVGAFLAASAAAGLQREGGVALRAPVASSTGGYAGSHPRVQ